MTKKPKAKKSSTPRKTPRPANRHGKVVKARKKAQEGRNLPIP